MEYENPMDKLEFDLKLVSNIMEELGIFLDFWTKEITPDEFSLPMRASTN